MSDYNKIRDLFLISQLAVFAISQKRLPDKLSGESFRDGFYENLFAYAHYMAVKEAIDGPKQK